MYREILLSAIVSIDIYLAASACCSGGIRIPMLPAAVISTICAAVMGTATGLSLCLCGLLPEGLFEVLSFAVLMCIGSVTVLKSVMRSIMKKLADREELSLRLGGCSIALRLYLDDTAADMDRSKELSVPEAAAMAAAGSFDCAATGLSCGGSGISPAAAALCTLVIGFAALGLGMLTGRKISSLRHDLSWVGGVVIIVFALYNAYRELF